MVSLLSETHKKQQEFEATEYYQNKLKSERYKIEAKNFETKVLHGLNKCKSVGLSRMQIQSYITHIVANIKRIVKVTEDLQVV